MLQTALGARFKHWLLNPLATSDIAGLVAADTYYPKLWSEKPSVLIYLSPCNDLGGWVFEQEEALPFAVLVGGSWEDASNLDVAFPSNVAIPQVVSIYVHTTRNTTSETAVRLKRTSKALKKRLSSVKDTPKGNLDVSNL